MILAERVEDFEEYMTANTICAACTSKDLAKIETLENKAADEVAEYHGLIRWSKSIISDTPLTFMKHLEDPIFCISDSPFDELEEKQTDEEKIKTIIDYVREELKIQFAQELSARLNFLHEIVSEDPDEVPISPESLRNFISFLRKTPNLKYPNIVLTPSNEISAQWRTAPNCHFAVVFLSSGEVRFVIFTSNPKDPNKIDRLSGITSTDSLIETVQPHGVLEWASQ